MAYGDPVQSQQQPTPQGQGQIDNGQGQYQDDGYYYPGDMWQGKPSQDHALQVREAQYSEVDRLQDEEGVFDDWKKSRRLMMARASRIPGIDSKTYNRLTRRWKYIVARAHSEGKSNILKTMCEDFDFSLELLVSKSDVQMPGMSGIGAMITNQSSSKQEIRMPQQQKQPGFWPWSK
jgi:hypothetical protein